MGEWTPGQKADATTVAKALRSGYTSWAKSSVRRKIIRSLVVASPQVVLDLWGGGASAEAMTRAGLTVLSVEDGRSFADVGVTKQRGRRALEISAQRSGYRWAWGLAAKHVASADAAFLDNMGHISDGLLDTLRACRHMKAIAVTAMPERAAMPEDLPKPQRMKLWRLAYQAWLEDATEMVVAWWELYQRDSGLPAFVFFLRPRTVNRRRQAVRPPCEGCGLVPRAVGAKKFCRSCADARKRSSQDSPAAVEYRRRYHWEHREERLAYMKWKRETFPEKVRQEKHESYLRTRERTRAKRNARYEPRPKVRRTCQRCCVTFWSQYPQAKFCDEHKIVHGKMLAVSGTTSEAVEIAA